MTQLSDEDEFAVRGPAEEADDDEGSRVDGQQVGVVRRLGRSLRVYSARCL